MNKKHTETSSRTRKLLAAAAGLLLILILGGVWLATRPDPAQQASSALPGDAVLVPSPEPSFTPAPPSFRAMKVNLEKSAIQPKHVGTGDMTLAKVSWTIPGGGHYVNLWQWDYEDPDSWRWYTEGAGSYRYRIYVKYYDWFIQPFVDYDYLAVENASKSEGANVIAFPDKGGDNHIWQFIDAGKDSAGTQYYLIGNYNSQLCLTIRDGVTTNGGALIQVTCNQEDDTQLWKVFGK